MSVSDEAAAAEARHRLANVLQLLTTLTRLRLQRASDDESRRQLAGVLSMTSAVGVIQQRLLKDGGLDLGACIDDMAAHWRRSCAQRPVLIALEVEPLEVREPIFSALALVAHELVTNAVAHGFPGDRAGSVRVSLRRLAGDQAELIVADDGQGFDPAAAEAGHLGLWLTRSLCGQAQAVLDLSASDGTTAKLTFAAAP